MSNSPFRGNRHMSREKLKLILFDWLKEKGILGELQAFLRMKMVEKLQGSELMGATQHTQFSAKDDAINTMVYDYLKQHHMYYTLSVFASECSSIQQQSISNLDMCVWKDVLNSLGIHNIDSAVPSKSGEAKCLLNFLVNAFGNISGKKNESKSCQCDVENIPKKLMLNIQSQTDVSVRNVNTLGVQTLPPNVCHTETQTADLLLSTIKRSSDELNSEIAELQNKLEQSQSALKLCQTKLLDSEKKIECLIIHKKERNVTTILPSSNVGSHVLKNPSTTTYNTRNRITCQKRIQEASRFLSHLDDRLQFLDQKYQNVAAVGSLTNDNQHLRYLPDSNVSSLAFS